MKSALHSQVVAITLFPLDCVCGGCKCSDLLFTALSDAEAERKHGQNLRTAWHRSSLSYLVSGCSGAPLYAGRKRSTCCLLSDVA